jgi:hypothetical protein
MILSRNRVLLFVRTCVTLTHTIPFFIFSIFNNQANPGFMTEQEERRHFKLIQLRRRGKGPPKKGSGKRKKK